VENYRAKNGARLVDGRLLNRALLQRAANHVNVEGVRRFPAVLDLSDIKVVLSLNVPDDTVDLYRRVESLLPINGASSVAIEIVSPTTLTGVMNEELETELVGLDIQVSWTGGGGTAMAGLFVGVQLYMSDPEGAGGPVYFCDLKNVVVPIAATPGGMHALLGPFSHVPNPSTEQMLYMGNQRITVPAGWTLKAGPQLSTGVFPADTVLSIQAIGRVKRDPRGLRFRVTDLS